ncbi:unnamed protein product [Cuscuta epithymum]|uniref:Dof-type domain-containing protein n=1 Tax=Cuscuta epithymum TaxID=186058 RepID=A0AAV0D8P6_9ASTE|nr:unnamed protein product [Cuscuta epithymum]
MLELMSDSSKDPAIKLFGKTIQLPDMPVPATESFFRDDAGTPEPSSDDGPGDDDSPALVRPRLANDPAEVLGFNGGGEHQQLRKNQYGGKLDDRKGDEGTRSLVEEELTDQRGKETEIDESKTMKKPETHEQGESSNSSQEKALKKPDKILPCPRCNSMETKFCYFNNYNVNQPRHFCKNCQRYWTAGGTMRNVPIGAGRRKNKTPGSHYRQVTIPEQQLPNGIIKPSNNGGGTLLTFGGSESPLCESMASVLNIAEMKTMTNKSAVNGENGDEHSTSGSSVTAASTELPDTPICPNFAPQMPCFPGAPPWPYPLTTVQWTPPGYCPPPGFPMSVYPAPAYWGCPVSWVGPPQYQHQMPSALGKHSRDENMVKPVNSEEEEQQAKKGNDPEKCLWAPKTLRIDDPQDAAKSSIWATLGVKKDKVDLVGSGGIFKAFHLKDEEKTDSSENSTVLQANPAALSRSLDFHESSLE